MNSNSFVNPPSHSQNLNNVNRRSQQEPLGISTPSSLLTVAATTTTTTVTTTTATVSESEPWRPKSVYSSEIPSSILIEHRDDIKSPSTTDSLVTDQTTAVSSSNEKSPLNDHDMKTEFVNFRKKQFETGHVENIVRDPQRESKTKKYSEKKKYENEWNRLTAIADVESVMDRASHFEDIDRDKFARLKSKLPSSPPVQDNLEMQESFLYDFNPMQHHFYDHSTQPQFKILKPSIRQPPLDSSIQSYQRGKNRLIFFRLSIDFFHHKKNKELQVNSLIDCHLSFINFTL